MAGRAEKVFGLFTVWWGSEHFSAEWRQVYMRSWDVHGCLWLNAKEKGWVFPSLGLYQSLKPLLLIYFSWEAFLSSCFLSARSCLVVPCRFYISRVRELARWWHLLSKNFCFELSFNKINKNSQLLYTKNQTTSYCWLLYFVGYNTFRYFLTIVGEVW